MSWSVLWDREGRWRTGGVMLCLRAKLSMGIRNIRDDDATHWRRVTILRLGPIALVWGQSRKR